MLTSGVVKLGIRCVLFTLHKVKRRWFLPKNPGTRVGTKFKTCNTIKQRLDVHRQNADGNNSDNRGNPGDDETCVVHGSTIS